MNTEKDILRTQFKAKRRALSAAEKAEKDRKIAERLCALPQYKRAKLLLLYAASPIEVGTDAVFAAAKQDGKQVAFPRCVAGTRQMEFYLTERMEDLQSGAFGILEPPAQPGRKVQSLAEGLCIVPALCYDRFGYRLGYGKGYYDRFLPHFFGDTVGITYETCFLDTLCHGPYDCAVQTVLTEERVLKID